MKYVVLFVLMGGIATLANWPALLASVKWEHRQIAS
jgi:hypothetical protein